MSHRRWKLCPSPPSGFLHCLGQPPLVNQLLYNRGITEAAHAESFLSIGHDLQHDPFLLNEMDRAVARIQRALANKETIAVYGDFDADGICGTAVLMEGLSRLGAKMISYFPHRVNEGYGLNRDSLDSLKKPGAMLVITLDCGITNNVEEAYDQEHGLDVIVTDHHAILRQLPPALATINPKRSDSTYPFSELAGVGVAFKLLQATLQFLGKEDGLENVLDLVAIGTIADKVPLLKENRYLAQKGLQELRRTRRPGLKAMAEVVRLEMQYLDSDDVSWTIAPRLNAPGRLDSAMTSYHLIMAGSSDEAFQLALRLEEKNLQRQKLTEEFLTRAKMELAASAGSPLLMVGGQEYPSGIAGLIAGKLSEEFYRPSFVYEVRDSIATGSARSIPEFDVVSALAQCGDLLERFGGHPAAAGFTLPKEKLAVFQGRLLDIAEQQLSGVDLRPHLSIDAVVSLADVRGKMFRLVERFAPFGYRNPMPAFLSRRAAVAGCHTMGAASQHLRLRLRDGRVTWRAVGFDLGQFAAEVTPEIDVVYNLVVDRWNGEEALALNILDFAPST